MRPLVPLIRHGHIMLGLHIGIGELARMRLLNANVLSEPLNFRQDHFAHLGYVLDDLEGEVEGRRAGWLVCCVVPDVEISVLEGFFDRDTGRGIECEHAVEQVERIWVCIGEELLKGLLWHEGEVSNVVLSSWRSDPGQGLFVGCA